MKSEEKNLLKNQILFQTPHRSKGVNIKCLTQRIISGIRTILDPKTQKLLVSLDQNTKSQAWFVPSFTRRESEEYLETEPAGTFVVRIGRNREYFALSLKSGDTEFDHYKIVHDQDGWGLSGCQKTFLSLSSLVLHLSILREVLPVTLRRDIKYRYKI